MKKRLASIALSLAITVVFAACGQNTETDSTKAVKEESTVSSESGDVSGEDWVPSKDITFVVPFEAGGNSDIPARIYAKYLAEYAGVNVNVTNIEGAGGRTGAEQAKEMDNDGSVILMQPVSYPMQYSMGVADFTYEDFEPVGQWLDSTLALVVNADSGIENMEQFIKKAEENPGTVKMGSVSGTLPMFAAMYLQQQNGVEFNLVDLSHNKAPELMSNRVDAYIDGFGSVKQYIDSGEFKCIALFTDTEVTGYEDLDTLAELGYEDYEYLKQTFGLWAPKGTPAAAVAYLNSAMQKASEDADCQAELTAVGFQATYLTTEDYTSYLKDTYAKFEEAAASLVN